MERIGLAGLVRSRAEGEAALRAAGADVDPELSLSATVGAVGPFDRWFGVVRRVPEGGVVRELLEPLLALPENAGLARRLADRTLSHLPVNRWVAYELGQKLLEGGSGAHLPFTFRPLNSDLAARLERKADARGGGGLSFRAYFNQGVVFDGGDVVLRRMFSLPVRGSAQGTEHDPYRDTALDDELGVVVEVFVEPG